MRGKPYAGEAIVYCLLGLALSLVENSSVRDIHDLKRPAAFS